MVITKRIKNFHVMYVAKMYREMQNKYVVISVTIGCTLSAMAYLPVNMTNYVLRTMMNLSFA